MRLFDSTQSKQFNNETINLGQKIKVALIKPPLIGHQYRGTGEYARRLYYSLSKHREIDISLVDGKILDDFDIIHYPYFDPFFLTLPFFKKRKTVVTVHDLIPLKFPEHFPPGLRGSIKWQLQKLSLTKVDAVITDSFSSKKDIMKYTGMSEDKIHVIYLGVGEEFKIIHSNKILKGIKNKLKLPDEFILHVGDVNYNKNIEGLIKAFNIVRGSYLTLNLVLVGDGFVNPSPQLSQINRLINSLNLRDKVCFIGHVATDDLVGLYNLAKVYLQPSFAEGFGLPVLEACACGCPVVCSNQSSLPEIVENKAILVDPYKIENIAKGTLKVLNCDKNQYRGLVENGFSHVKKFTWSRCAFETVNIYKKIISKGNK